ncbi:kti12, chromatin associated [Exophiala oligosperma]
MPLIIITGLPCSGKTHRAQQIAADLENYIASSDSVSLKNNDKKKKTVQIIPSQHASADISPPPPPPPPPSPPQTKVDDSSSGDPELVRDHIYNSAAQEKTARAAEFSAIKRAVSRDNIVIADGLNYIKGYRYQLWCEAKAAGTRCCVVHVAAQEEECKKWNRERQRVWGRRRDERAEDEDGGTGNGNGNGDGDAGGTKRTRSKAQGEAVMGDLVPESHTAIYGDRIVGDPSLSRSSSMDGFGGEDDERSRPRPQIQQDTMTLKSLYISDRTERDHSKAGEGDSTTNTNAPTRSGNSSSPLAVPPSTDMVPPPPTGSRPYSSSTLTSLIMRYEPPSPFSRWDTPLFTVPSADSTPPSHDIWTALFPPRAKPTSKKAPSQRRTAADSVAATANSTRTEQQDERGEEVKKHAATVLPRATGSDALQILENATMEVVKHLLARARETGVADVDCCGDVDLFLIPSTTGTTTADGDARGPGDAAGGYENLTLYVPSTVALSQPLLQRLRRTYTQIQRGGIAHGQGYVKGRRAVIKGFVGFLENEWNDD